MPKSFFCVRQQILQKFTYRINAQPKTCFNISCYSRAQNDNDWRSVSLNSLVCSSVAGIIIMVKGEFDGPSISCQERC